MMKITVAALGKLKEPYMREAAAEYEKRLSRYCDLATVEITPEDLPEQPSQPQIEAALSREAAKIEKTCAGKRVIALCIEGERYSSERFAALIAEAESTGTPLAFVIGSSHGLHESVKKAAYKRVSFSDMTFPHRLFRVMLLEQLYRAFKINEGGSYHK